MREKLQTLPLAELKELAKSQGLKGISTLRKAEIIELLCRENEAAAQSEAVLQPDSGSSEGREAQSSREPQSSKENGEPRDSGKPRDGRPQRDSSRQTRFVRQPRTSYGQQNSREAPGIQQKAGSQRRAGNPGKQETFVTPERHGQTSANPVQSLAVTLPALPVRIWQSLTAELRQTVFWKLCRMALALSAAKISFREKMTFMWLLHRSAGSI